MYRKILQWPAKQLRTESKLVKDVSKVQETIKDLIDTCNIEMGAGLAANQIGVTKKIVVIKPSAFGHENPDPSQYNENYMVLINPSLHNTGDDIKWKESCLSLKPIEGTVERKTETMVNYTSETGQEKKLIAEWPFSGGLQHECDHLDGKVFTNRMNKRVAAFLLEKRRRKLKKMQREAKRAAKGKR